MCPRRARVEEYVGRHWCFRVALDDRASTSASFRPGDDDVATGLRSLDFRRGLGRASLDIDGGSPEGPDDLVRGRPEGLSRPHDSPGNSISRSTTVKESSAIRSSTGSLSRSMKVALTVMSSLLGMLHAV